MPTQRINVTNARTGELKSEIKNLPLVSCIMTTHNRRRFVSQAIEYFSRQDYPNRELIIVDDGTNVIKDLVPDDLRIHYRRQEHKRTIQVNRNLACTRIWKPFGRNF